MPRPAAGAAAVCDTHALVYYAFGGQRLGKRAAALFDACDAREAIIYVPAIVIVEFAMVRDWRRWALTAPRRLAERAEGSGRRQTGAAETGSRSGATVVRDFFEGLFTNPAYQPLDLTSEQVFMATEARPNTDPFDGLICAAARRLDLPLITRDHEIERWGRVAVVW